MIASELHAGTLDMNRDRGHGLPCRSTHSSAATFPAFVAAFPTDVLANSLAVPTMISASPRRTSPTRIHVFASESLSKNAPIDASPPSPTGGLSWKPVDPGGGP